MSGGKHWELDVGLGVKHDLGLLQLHHGLLLVRYID